MKFRNPVFAPAIVAVFLSLSFAANSNGQGLSVYSPIASEYRIGEFLYNAPREDGWRQVTSAPGMFMLVYAEELPTDEVNTRVHIVAESHEVPEESRAMVEDAQWLAGQSFGQQKKEREGRIIAYSPIEPVGDSDLRKFTLVTSGPQGKDLFESFYLKLAPDRSSYLIVKMTTSENDFQEQVYLKQLEDSLIGVRTDAAVVETEAETDTDEQVEDKAESVE